MKIDKNELIVRLMIEGDKKTEMLNLYKDIVDTLLGLYACGDTPNEIRDDKNKLISLSYEVMGREKITAQMCNEVLKEMKND